MLINEPLFFERNRVGRVYIGGGLFAGLFGDEPQDGYEPEEWIASRVRAINRHPKGPREGVSRVKGSGAYFDDLLEQYPIEMLGKRGTLRILVKALDSAVRLPVQVHPDKAFSRKYFGSEYGKTECWVILDTRPGAKLFFGFRNGVSRADLQRAIDASETDRDAMENLLSEVTPQKGEVYLVPARTAHAIGYGCLILEVQEPTDFTIQPERYCSEYRLSDREMYIGLDREKAVDCFDFGETPQALLRPRVMVHAEGTTVERLVGEEHTDCFAVNRIYLDGGRFCMDVSDSYAVYIVTEGTATVCGEGYTRTVKKGDYFFMPACLMGRFTVSGQAELIECY